MLEHILVEELRQRGVLEDVISEYGIENLRACGTCGKLMREGWLYADFETYCSDECFIAAHPEEDLAELKRKVADNDSEIYWTAWEG